MRVFLKLRGAKTDDRRELRRKEIKDKSLKREDLLIFLTSREKERKKERKGRKKPHNNNIKPHARFNFATNGKRTSEKSGDGDDHEQSTASAKRRVFAGERLLDFVRVYHIVSILFYSFVSFRFSEEKRVAPSLLFSLSFT